MIINKCVRNLLKKYFKTVSVTPSANIHNRSLIGNRDWVGWGINGRANYLDCMEFPCPAVRFRENTNELLALREKEKGDWRKLSLEEKKCLYRASFRQTLAEADAPTGQWKSFIGMTLGIVAVGICSFSVLKLCIYDPKPMTFTEEYRKQMLRRILDLRLNAITGPPAYWDYEADDWKK